MEIDVLLILGVLVLSLVALIGFFITKTKGFGRFSTSSLLLLLIVLISALLFVAGKLDGQIVSQIFFAVIGFAGGLFTGTDYDKP